MNHFCGVFLKLLMLGYLLPCAPIVGFTTYSRILIRLSYNFLHMSLSPALSVELLGPLLLIQSIFNAYFVPGSTCPEA